MDEARRTRLQGVRRRRHGLEVGNAALHEVDEAEAGRDRVFAYIVYKSRAHRDRVNAKVMKEMNAAGGPPDMPFDMKRMVYGGFKTLVE
jgi:uncharacterized protein YbaA (DUF1428 family)